MSNDQRPPGVFTSESGEGFGPIGMGAAAVSASRRGGAHAETHSRSATQPQAFSIPAAPASADAEFVAQWEKFERFARETFEQDLARAREKAMEYGSHDLEIMATSMEALLPEGHLDAQSRHAAGLEMAISFYLLGKVSRLFGAWKKGTSPGNDSWRDGLIYALMARYVRVNGRWIG